MTQSVLTDYERRELADKYRQWQAAREQKDYTVADALRQELIDYGCDLERATWHPVLEAPKHRQSRLERRQRGCQHLPEAMQ